MAKTDVDIVKKWDADDNCERIVGLIKSIGIHKCNDSTMPNWAVAVTVHQAQVLF